MEKIILAAPYLCLNLIGVKPMLLSDPTACSESNALEPEFDLLLVI